MQEKIIEILSSANGWMMANKIADIGGWRSAANVGVALAQMEKANGSVMRRKSPTERMNNGMPATEWKLAEKDFSAAAPEAKNKEKPIDIPVVKKSFTTETDEVVASLRKQIADLEDDIRRQVQRANAAEANRDDLKKDRDAHRDDVLMWERSMMKVIGEDGVGSVTDAIKNLQAFLAQTGERADAAEKMVRMIELNLEHIDGANALEKVCQVMHERANAKEVKDAAIGYIVRVVGKKPRICAKPESAHAAAMSSARVHGKAEVLALVPVGKAVRGAEWKEAA